MQPMGRMTFQPLLDPGHPGLQHRIPHRTVIDRDQPLPGLIPDVRTLKGEIEFVAGSIFLRRSHHADKGNVFKPTQTFQGLHDLAFFQGQLTFIGQGLQLTTRAVRGKGADRINPVRSRFKDLQNPATFPLWVKADRIPRHPGAMKPELSTVRTLSQHPVVANIKNLGCRGHGLREFGGLYRKTVVPRAGLEPARP